MRNLKTYKQLFESKSDIKDKIEKLFNKYDFDFMFVGWCVENLVIDEIFKKSGIITANGTLNEFSKNERFNLPIDQLDPNVKTELNEWYDSITLELLLESSRFDITNLTKILKVEKENVKDIKINIVKDVLESLNELDDKDNLSELESLELQKLFITDNFLISFFELVDEYNLKNHLENTEKYKKYLKDKQVKKFKI